MNEYMHATISFESKTRIEFTHGSAHSHKIVCIKDENRTRKFAQAFTDFNFSVSFQLDVKTRRVQMC